MLEVETRDKPKRRGIGRMRLRAHRQHDHIGWETEAGESR
jgi:hypothetical protein